MEPGNMFTIEPIILMNRGQYFMWKDNFTTLSPDNPSAQWEHTILITESGHEIITKREDEII
jgi:methionyl aminopeptidase